VKRRREPEAPRGTVAGAEAGGKTEKLRSGQAPVRWACSPARLVVRGPGPKHSDARPGRSGGLRNQLDNGFERIDVVQVLHHLRRRSTLVGEPRLGPLSPIAPRPGS